MRRAVFAFRFPPSGCSRPHNYLATFSGFVPVMLAETALAGFRGLRDLAACRTAVYLQLNCGHPKPLAKLDTSLAKLGGREVCDHRVGELLGRGSAAYVAGDVLAFLVDFGQGLLDSVGGGFFSQVLEHQDGAQ